MLEALIIFGAIPTIVGIVKSLEFVDAGIDKLESDINNYGQKQKAIGYKKGTDEGAQSVKKVTNKFVAAINEKQVRNEAEKAKLIGQANSAISSAMKEGYRQGVLDSKK